MRKILYILVALFVMAPMLQGADAAYIRYLILGDSTWRNTAGIPYSAHYIDTMTIHYKYGDTLIDFGMTLYNVRIKSINANALDSGAIKVSLGNGIWHNDSVARNLTWKAVGGTGNDTPDTVSYLYFGAIGIRYLPVRPMLRTGGGVRCSTTIIRAEGWR